MSEEISLDAEGSTRNKNYSAQDHLAHLLKIGYSPNSALIKNFVEAYNLQSELREFINSARKQEES